MHGLCTYGFTGRALVHLACGSNPDNFESMDGRFSSPVIPGETLEIRVWEDEDHFKFRTLAGDRVVLDNGVLHTR